MIWWLLAVVAGTMAMILAGHAVGAGPFAWGIGYFVMFATGWPWMRKRGYTSHGLLVHTLMAAGAAVIGLIAAILFQFLLRR